MKRNTWRATALRLVSRATLAPSSHNTQPWTFRVTDDAIELRSDPLRALPINDPHDRELVISCGAALFNLRVAAASIGLHCDLHVAAADGGLAAKLAFTQTDAADHEAGLLAAQIDTRRTWRGEFAARSVDERTLAALRRAAELEGAVLNVFTAPDDRHALAALVSAGDAAQWSNGAWRRELAHWIRPASAGDGLAVARGAAAITRAVIRTFNLGRRVGVADQKRLLEAPIVAVIGTHSDDWRAWLQAGQALQRVLLCAARYGLQASFLNQPVEVEALRCRLAALTPSSTPQLLLRLGFPVSEARPAPRRELDDVVQWAN